VNAKANEEGRVKVFIIKTEYWFEVSPSPVVVPRGVDILEFENLSGDTATIFIPGTDSLTLKHNGKQLVKLPDSKDKLIYYEVKMTGAGLSALGNSAPIIIRDP
jgi:hypothetical protein